MKFSIELNNEKVVYSYEVGTSKATSESSLSVDWIMAFSQILRLAYSAWTKAVDDRRESWLRSFKPEEEKAAEK